MAIPLKYNTNGQEVPLGVFIDKSDGATTLTGLTITQALIQLWKAGGSALAQKNAAGTAASAGHGCYVTTLSAEDVATYGALKIYAFHESALPCVVECWVMNADAYDALFAAGDTGAGIDANLRTVMGDPLTGAKPYDISS